MTPYTVNHMSLRVLYVWNISPHGWYYAYIFTGKLSYKIDKEKLVISKLFKLLDSVKIQLGISDWGVKRTTLEDGNMIIVDVCYMISSTIQYFLTLLLSPMING